MGKFAGLRNLDGRVFVWKSIGKGNFNPTDFQMGIPFPCPGCGANMALIDTDYKETGMSKCWCCPSCHELWESGHAMCPDKQCASVLQPYEEDTTAFRCPVCGSIFDTESYAEVMGGEGT